MMKKWNIAARRRARRFALQALYQWHFNPDTPDNILAGFLVQDEIVSVDTDFFKALVKGVIKDHVQLDEQMETFKQRSSSVTQPVEQAILRIAMFEMNQYPETPYRVILNEAIELTKAFGAEGSNRYINGMLHALAQQYRPYERSTG